MSKKGEEQPEIVIEEQEGSYCTNCMINFNPTEFIFDFGTLQPGIHDLGIKPKIRYHTRIRTSPQHAKMIYQVLNGQLAQYEKNIGEIRLPSQPSKTPPAVA
jgi:hypothetical protein